MGESGRFLPCPSCARVISALLERCPYCRQATEFPPPSPVEPSSAETAGAAPADAPAAAARRRRPLWPWVAGVAAVAVAGLAWFLATRGPGEGPVCPDLQGAPPAAQYLQLNQAFADAPSGAEWEDFLEEATRGCGDLLDDLIDQRPGLITAPPEVEWRVGADTPSWERERATEMVLAAQALVAFYAGEPLGALTVYMDTDRTALARAMGGPYEEAYDRLGQGMWFGGSGAIYVNLSQQRLQYPYDFPVVAHEIMHVFQGALVRPPGFEWGHCPESAASGIGIEGPAWLVEGSAEVVGWAALTDSPYWPLAGLSSDPEDLLAGAFAPGLEAPLPLEDLASWAAWNLQDPQIAYSLAHAGGTALTDIAGRNSLFEYFRLLGRGECWEEAFTAAFGFSADGFYRSFESGRPG